MDSGFAFFIIVLIFLALVFGFLAFAIWVLYSKKGQRMDRKQQMRQQVKQGMRDEEIEDGLMEEVVTELAEKERLKRGGKALE